LLIGFAIIRKLLYLQSKCIKDILNVYNEKSQGNNKKRKKKLLM